MMAASTEPCSMAATAVAPRPMPITPTEFGSTPFLLSMIFQEEVGRGAGRADADLLVGEVLDRIDLAGVLRRHHQREAGIAVIDHEGLQVLVLGGEIDAMVEIAGHHVGAAADHRGERLRAALEIDHLDIDAGLFVFAELLGQHGRQVAQAARAADRDGDLRSARAASARHQRQRARAKRRAAG